MAEGPHGQFQLGKESQILQDPRAQQASDLPARAENSIAPSLGLVNLFERELNLFEGTQNPGNTYIYRLF